MNETKQDTVVNGVKLEEGKMYLRDKRNGRIFQYEESLAELRYIERFEFNGELPKEPSDGYETKITLSGIEKAAEWDRLASLKPEEREAELNKRKAYEEEQEALREKSQGGQQSAENPYVDADISMTDTNGPTLEEYRKQGWTNEQLLQHNLATFNK